MTKRRYTATLACHHPGCQEYRLAQYDNRREYNDGEARRNTWMCLRHSSPEKWLTRDRLSITTERVVQIAGKAPRLYWDGHSGFTSGDGYMAEADDFPPGTKLIVTAQIILPELPEIDESKVAKAMVDHAMGLLKQQSGV